MENLQITIIINTKNEEKHIKRCLDSICSQNYPSEKIEIIVVDNASQDKTKEVSLKYTDKVYDKGPERSAQKNFGAKRAKGEWLLFIDADMVLSRDLVKNCVDAITGKEKIAGLFIREIVMGKKFWSRVRRFERSFYDGTVIDAVRFVRKSAFEDVEGFDEKLYACEDWDLTKRMEEKGDFVKVKSVIYHNEEEFNVKRYLNKKNYYIQNMEVYIKKWGKIDSDLKKQFGIAYRFFGVFIEDGKWKKLLAHPVMAIGMYYLRFLVGVKFLLKRK